MKCQQKGCHCQVAKMNLDSIDADLEKHALPLTAAQRIQLAGIYARWASTLICSVAGYKFQMESNPIVLATQCIDLQESARTLN